MKKYILLYVLLVAAIIAGLSLCFSFMDIPVGKEVDLLAVNEIAKAVEQNWHDVQKLHNYSFLYRACAIDNNGQIVWATDREVADTLQEAMRKGYTILEITVDGDVAGKVVIKTDSDEFFIWARERFASLAMLAVILLCSVSVLFLLGVHIIVVRPFQKLERFAHKISTGKFDEPLPMDKSNVFGLFTQSFDVMRSSLLRARSKQLEAERAKKELIASLSHDIKTPVTSIKLIVELLLAGTPEPALYKRLKTIEAKTDQINRLMSNMMHSTLEELGELKVNLTSESSGILRDLFENVNDYERVKIGPIPSCMVDLDMPRMEQVIGNILANSYKYADTDIDVACEVDGDFLRVDINDYGPGVEPEAVELVCSKFYRGENAKASQKDGEGLGLYVARLFMQKMGGGLVAYNRQDGFSVRLMLRLSK